VRRIDHGGHVMGGQPGGQALRAAEPADPHLAGRQGRIADPAGQRRDRPQPAAAGQAPGKLARLGGAAQDEHGRGVQLPGSGHPPGARRSR